MRTTDIVCLFGLGTGIILITGFRYNKIPSVIGIIFVSIIALRYLVLFVRYLREKCRRKKWKSTSWKV